MKWWVPQPKQVWNPSWKLPKFSTMHRLDKSFFAAVPAALVMFLVYQWGNPPKGVPVPGDKDYEIERVEWIREAKERQERLKRGGPVEDDESLSFLTSNPYEGMGKFHTPRTT
mmetsp:Transcript_27186/g.78194  ORF Transcript_27186/g.78194 Transcript_27186/m.78194 type:complete len:113 (-) Transcript_27186:680-1018(-)